MPTSHLDKLGAAAARSLDVTVDTPADGDHCYDNPCHIVHQRVAERAGERLGARTGL